MKKLLALASLLPLLATLAHAQTRPGSVYNPDRSPGSPITAKIAVQKGDIVTVLIAESQNVRNQEQSDLSKSTNLNYKVNLFDLKPNVFNALPTSRWPLSPNSRIAAGLASTIFWLSDSTTSTASVATWKRWR